MIDPLLPKEDLVWLVNAYHTGKGLYDTRWERMDYAARMYHREHPETSVSKAYKALERALA